VKRFFILSSLPKENSSGRIASRKVLELLEMELWSFLERFCSGKVLEFLWSFWSFARGGKHFVSRHDFQFGGFQSCRLLKISVWHVVHVC
jgi:hypothetical protein